MNAQIKTKFKETEIGIREVAGQLQDTICRGQMRMIPEEWEEVIFSEAITVNPKRELTKGIKTKFVSMADILPFQRKITNFIIKEFKSGSKFQNNDTLFARITPCLENGKTAFVDILDYVEIGFGSTEFIVLSAKKEKTEPYFVYYLSRSPEIRKAAIKSMTGTSGRQRVENKVFDSVIINLPSLIEQSAIAKILSDLDAKIELNQRMNKTLEAIGQAIFKRWFVDFEFPDENGEPYKSSGGEMVDSELGEIPKGWGVEGLRRLVKRNRDKLNNKQDWENKNIIDLSTMSQFSICLDSFQKGEKFDSNIYKLKEMDILFGSIRPYFGKAGFSPINGVVTGTIFSYLPKQNDHYAYVLFLSTSKDFIDFTVAFSKGTKMPIIGWDDFCSYKSIIPADDELFKRFNQLLMPLIFKIKVNIQQIQALSQIRDALLPKLMSGKIRVPVENK